MADLTQLINGKLKAIWGGTGDDISKQALIPPLSYGQALGCLSICIDALNEISKTYDLFLHHEKVAENALAEVRRIVGAET